MKSRLQTLSTVQRQGGLSLLELIFWCGLLGFFLLLGMKCLAPVTEYMSIKKALNTSKSAGEAAAIRNAFDANVKAGYIESINGRDLKIESVNGITTVSFAYQKIIPIAGPVSLLFDFTNTELVR